jgi:dTDP-4-dehydrorhamnose reductase
MKVVIIGSTGQLAQDLLKVFGGSAGSAIGLSHQDVDVTDGVNLTLALQSLHPDWVLNTAAFLRVDDCELNPSQAFAVNALGALNVSRRGFFLHRLCFRRRTTRPPLHRA